MGAPAEQSGSEGLKPSGPPFKQPMYRSQSRYPGPGERGAPDRSGAAAGSHPEAAGLPLGTTAMLRSHAFGLCPSAVRCPGKVPREKRRWWGEGCCPQKLKPHLAVRGQRQPATPARQCPRPERGPCQRAAVRRAQRGVPVSGFRALLSQCHGRGPKTQRVGFSGRTGKPGSRDGRRKGCPSLWGHLAQMLVTARAGSPVPGPVRADPSNTAHRCAHGLAGPDPVPSVARRHSEVKPMVMATH